MPTPRFVPLLTALFVTTLIVSNIIAVKIGAIFGYLTQEKWWKRLALFIAAIPLAVLGNVVRVTLILFVADWFGQEAGKKVHDWGGFVIFVVVLLCLFGVGSLLDLNVRALLRRWLDRVRSKKEQVLP